MEFSFSKFFCIVLLLSVLLFPSYISTIIAPPDFCLVFLYVCVHSFLSSVFASLHLALCFSTRVIAMSISLFFLTFLTFLDHLLVQAGQCFSHPVFSILCRHVSSQLVFLHVYLYVVPPSLSRSVSVPSPRSLYIVLAISHRCGWVLVSSSGQTTLVFFFNFSTGFTLASFLMSSFLMGSNLVFPLANLNILISAEFSLLSSFFFTAQHSNGVASQMFSITFVPPASYFFCPAISILFIPIIHLGILTCVLYTKS